MHHDHVPDLAAIERWLVTAHITTFSQWDMLVFLSHYRTSLVSAEHMARLLGYATGEVVTVLESLEAQGFVARSRTSQGVRLYQFTVPTDTPPGDACHRLLRVADSRAVRLLLAKRWRRGDRRPDTHNRTAHVSSLKGGKPWRKVS
jgi:hypothetical protein